MGTAKLTLTVLPETFAVCRLPVTAVIPTQLQADPFFAITKTTDELSIVCLVENIPSGCKVEQPWRAIKVNGPLDFALTGIMASLVNPLAQAGISIFAISTFDTDYVLVKADTLATTIEVLSNHFEILETAN